MTLEIDEKSSVDPLDIASPDQRLSTDSDQFPENPQNRADIDLAIPGGDLPVAPATYSRFIQFLTDELSISTSSIDFAVRHRENSCDPLPMILWQYGFISLEQLDRIFDWLETA
jgi:hypothetical protein